MEYSTILTSDMGKLKLFFEQVFGAFEGPSPDANVSEHSLSLFVGDEFLVRLAPKEQQVYEPLDHVIDHLEIISGVDYVAFRQKLDAQQITYSTADIQNDRQKRILFVLTDGLVVEAIFKDQP